MVESDPVDLAVQRSERSPVTHQLGAAMLLIAKKSPVVGTPLQRQRLVLAQAHTLSQGIKPQVSFEQRAAEQAIDHGHFDGLTSRLDRFDNGRSVLIGEVQDGQSHHQAQKTHTHHKHKTDGQHLIEPVDTALGQSTGGVRF